MLIVDSVQRSYRPPTGLLRMLTRSAVDHPVMALDGVSFTARPGRIHGLVGPNGAGKTTLIRIVAGLLDADVGTVSVAGADPSSERRRAGRALGLVLADDRSLYWRLSGRQNLEFHGVLHGLSRTGACRRVDELLDAVGLRDVDRRVFGYSTGMRAKLGIARALVHDPPVIVLDEPTRSLDPIAAAQVCAMLRDLAAEGRTVILSSHRLEELERTADDVSVLIAGRLRFSGTVTGLRSRESSVAATLEHMLQQDPFSGGGDMSVVLGVLRRDWAIERTYQLRLVLEFLDVAVVATGLYFISLLVEDPASLADYGGNYFDFVIVGLAVTSFAGVGLSSFGDSLSREQSTGTIDLLLASPASIPALMAGMFMFPFILAGVQVAGLLGFGIGVVGSGLPIGGVLLSVPVLLLTTATFAAVGIVVGGIMLLVKRGDPISGPFYAISMLVSGVIVPVEVLPRVLRSMSWFFPATWGVQAVRELLLSDGGWRDVLPETLALVGFVVVMLPLSILIYRACLRTAKRQGVLGSY